MGLKLYLSHRIKYAEISPVLSPEHVFCRPSPCSPSVLSAWFGLCSVQPSCSCWYYNYNVYDIKDLREIAIKTSFALDTKYYFPFL